MDTVGLLTSERVRVRQLAEGDQLLLGDFFGDKLVRRVVEVRRMSGLVRVELEHHPGYVLEPTSIVYRVARGHEVPDPPESCPTVEHAIVPPDLLRWAVDWIDRCSVIPGDTGIPGSTAAEDRERWEACLDALGIT